MTTLIMRAIVIELAKTFFSFSSCSIFSTAPMGTTFYSGRLGTSALRVGLLDVIREDYDNSSTVCMITRYGKIRIACKSYLTNTRFSCCSVHVSELEHWFSFIHFISFLKQL